MRSVDSTIRLRDGRSLAYREHGDLSGQPVFFLHGNPGSRLMRHPDETIADSLGVRMIATDRPGFGRSDPHPGRTLRSTAADLCDLADALAIDRFDVIGVSAGGPHALAAAHALASRVRAVAVVSGIGPLDREADFEGMHSQFRAAFRAIEKMPDWLVRSITWVRTRRALRNPGRAVAETAATLSEDDQRILARPEIRDQVATFRGEATRQGVGAVIEEARVLMAPWGFRPEDIGAPVDLWYWAEDRIVPPQMGRRLAARMPSAVPRFLPGGGHFMIYDAWRPIIEALGVTRTQGRPTVSKEE